MMIDEFEARTGIFPPADLYRVIEQFYTDSDMDKDDFCKAYKGNDNYLAERIQRAANLARFDAENVQRQQAAELRAEIEKRDGQIDRLRRDLDRAEGWQPYEYQENAKQADYDRLRKAGRVMTDDEARDLLADWYCFQPDKITILHTVPKIEKNRFNQCRRAGEYDRLPVYDATDWNYIRFDCGMMTYELINGALSLFVH